MALRKVFFRKPVCRYISPGIFAGLKQLGRKGMTLIELVIVVAIVGTLAGIATPSYLRYISKTKMLDVISQFRIMEINLELYNQFNDEYPERLDMVVDVPIDPWGNPYQYVRVAGAKIGELRKDHNMVPVNTDYDLYSKGADGKSVGPFTAKSSQDDIVRANNGEFLGLVSDY